MKTTLFTSATPGPHALNRKGKKRFSQLSVVSSQFADCTLSFVLGALHVWINSEALYQIEFKVQSTKLKVQTSATDN